MTKKLKDILKQSLIYVDDNNVSKRDIQYLIKETFSLTETKFILQQDELFDDALLMEKIKELITGKPVEYILGYSYFCGNKFEVNENTLIPRGETEDLIYKTIEKIIEEKIEVKKVLDIGSGSGCIPITLSKMISGAQLESVDISSKALEVAKRNNELNGTNVNFYLSDCFENVTGKFDLIISNPPYIDRDTYVQDSVLKYEPHSALFADDHGLAIYEKIITSLIDYINDKAIVAFEISPDLVERLITLVDKNLKRCKYCIEKDINGFDRYLFIYIN